MAKVEGFDREAYARFEVEGRSYVLKYTIERVDLYEAAHGSLGALLWAGDVFLKHAQLRDLLAYGVKLEGGEWVNPDEGARMADTIIERTGYMDTLTIVLAALKEDCGFLFAESTI